MQRFVGKGADSFNIAVHHLAVVFDDMSGAVRRHAHRRRSRAPRIDNVALTREQISGWIAETLGGSTGNLSR